MLMFGVDSFPNFTDSIKTNVEIMRRCDFGGGARCRRMLGFILDPLVGLIFILPDFEFPFVNALGIVMTKHRIHGILNDLANFYSAVMRRWTLQKVKKI